MDSAEAIKQDNGLKPLQESVHSTLLSAVAEADAPGLPASSSKSSAKEPASTSVRLRQAAAEFSGTMAAGIAGCAAWALLERVPSGGLARVAGTGVISGSARVLAKGALETLLLSKSDRTTSTADFAWGVVDGFAGVAGSLADARVGRAFASALGMRYLGADIGVEMAELTGRKAIESSLADRLLSYTVRGIGGGAAGGFAWSVPHSLYNHRNQLDTGQGWADAGKEVAFNCAFGAGVGGALGASITAAGNARDIVGYAAARLKGDADVSRVTLLHFNDLHSSLVGERGTLSQLATEVSTLRARSAAANRTAFLFDLGDNYSGNVASSFTGVGYVETKGINLLKPDAFIAGNHVADIGRGRVDVGAWVNNIQRISRELDRELPALGTNMELVNYPGFAGPSGKIYKPYRILQMKGRDGALERVGVIGLTTEELSETAHGEVLYLNAKKEGQRWIDHLNKPQSEGGEGVNRVIALTHLGRSEDIKLATQVRGISYIAGAHSHDAEPVLLWARNPETLWDVPIMQAGCKGKWLAETNLAFKKNGAADKYRSFTTVHPIHKGIAADETLSRFIGQAVPSLTPLSSRAYSAAVASDFPLEGIRGQYGKQTELGTLVATATREGVNSHLPSINAERAAQHLEPLAPFTIMLKHSQDLRAGLKAGQPSHRDLSDVFLHSGRPEVEKGELAGISVTGADLEKILNFSVLDLPLPKGVQRGANLSGISGKLAAARDLWLEPGLGEVHDYSGYFLQTDGLKFKFDLLRPPGQKVVDIQVRLTSDPMSPYVPLDKSQTYNVLTLFNPVQLWGRQGVLGEAVRLSRDPGHAALNYLNAQEIKLSQVDLLAEHLSAKKFVSPEQYAEQNSVNLTARSLQPAVRPLVRPLAAVALAESAEARKSSQK